MTAALHRPHGHNGPPPTSEQDWLLREGDYDTTAREVLARLLTEGGVVLDLLPHSQPQGSEPSSAQVEYPKVIKQ